MFCEQCGTVLDPEFRCVNCLKEANKKALRKEEVELADLG